MVAKNRSVALFPPPIQLPLPLLLVGRAFFSILFFADFFNPLPSDRIYPASPTKGSMHLIL